MKGAVILGVLCFVLIDVIFGLKSVVPTQRRGPHLSAPNPSPATERRVSAAQKPSHVIVNPHIPFQVQHTPNTNGAVPVRIPAPKPQQTVFPQAPFVPPQAPYVPPHAPFVPPHAPFVPPHVPFVPPQAPFVPPHAPFVPPQAPFVPPQAPFVPPHVPFVPPQAPFIPPQAPFVPPQAPFVPPQAPFIPQAPFVPPQAPFVPPQAPFVPPQAPFVPPQAPFVPFVPPQAPFVPPQAPFVPPQAPFVPPQSPFRPPVVPVRFPNVPTSKRTFFGRFSPVPATQTPIVPNPSVVVPTQSLCENGQPRVSCAGSQTCNTAHCKAYPAAECRMDSCNSCSPRFFVQNVAVSCDMCRNGYMPSVGLTRDPVTGNEDACRFADCPFDHYCHPNYCTLPELPTPVFQCVPNCRDSIINSLIGDGRRQECLLDPCLGVICPQNHMCKANQCTCSGMCILTESWGPEVNPSQSGNRAEAPTTEQPDPVTQAAVPTTHQTTEAATETVATTERAEERQSVTTERPIADVSTNAPTANQVPVIPLPVEENHTAPN